MKKRYGFSLKTFVLAGFNIAFILLLSGNCQAQNIPYKLWDKTFGGCGTDDFTSMKPTADGGYIFAGYSVSNITGDKSEDMRGFSDYWIVKTDANGNKLWDKTIGGNKEDDLKAIEQTPDGGYVLAGWSYSEISAEKSQNAKTFDYADYWVMKLDVNGNKIWDKVIGGNLNDYLNTMIVTSDGGILLVGWSGSNVGFDKSQSTQASMDAWVVKLDANGNKLWDKTFGGFGIDNLNAVQETSDGGFILGGTVQLSGNIFSQGGYGGYDYWVLKLNSSGNEVWSKVFGGSKDDKLTSVCQASDGGYIVGGYSSSEKNNNKSQDPIGGEDYWVLKLNSNGNKEWDKVFGGTGNDLLNSVQQTFEGGFILGGNSASLIGFDKSEAPRGGSDFWILKIDVSGNKIWDKTIGGNMNDELYSVQQTSDGNFILGGSSQGGIGYEKSQPGQGFGDYWVVRLASPDTPITTKFTYQCNGTTSGIQANIIGIPPAKAGNLSWAITYLENGISKTVTSTAASVELKKNALPGSTYTLKKIESGTFVKNLSETVTVPGLPAAPEALASNKCGKGPVSLTAKGAEAGGKYIWYTVPSGGEPVSSNPSGNFVTQLAATTTYYVAASNSWGCEGPRTPVTAILKNCSAPVFPNLITPNNDGTGDTFIPQKLLAGKWAISIFDNSGTKNFESDDYQNNWPVNKVSNGVYFFILSNSETNEQYTGKLVVMQ
jgi:hypothetical protein